MKLLNLPQFQRFCNGDFRVKVVRHRDSMRDLWGMCRDGRFGAYQNVQGWDVFGTAEFIISFIAEQNRYAKFVGVWRVLNKRRRPKRGFVYRTEEVSGFDDLKGRLVVHWGEGTRSWAQWLDGSGNKVVFEILPPNFVASFPGYYAFTLSYEALANIIKHPDSHREWQRKLSSVSGVYLVLDTKSGDQYIGSAYGRGGIWSRWRRYAKNPSGGNLLFEQLLEAKHKRYKDFQYSIMRVLEPSATKHQVLAEEALLKQKLGTRAFGLNSN